MKLLSAHSFVRSPRRKFLKQLCAGYTATLAYPVWRSAPIHPNTSLPSARLLRNGENTPDEKYWEMVKQQFTVPPPLVMVNAANLCPSPYFINEQVVADTKNLATNVSFQNRVRQLCTYLKEQIQTHLPNAEFITPLSPELSGGVVIINLPDKPPGEFFQILYEEHGIACAPTGGIRFSPHIYNTLEDMDRIVTALVSVSA